MDFDFVRPLAQPGDGAGNLYRVGVTGWKLRQVGS